MKPIKLDEPYFLSTFKEPVIKLTENDLEMKDIEKYKSNVFENELHDFINEEHQLESIDQRANDYIHIAYWYQQPNIYLMIVVDCKSNNIVGHFHLNLNEKYGLSN